MAVTTERRTRDMLTVTRDSLLSLRAALLRTGDAQAVVTLQEAGYAGGNALFDSFRSWLAERTSTGMEDLDIEAFQRLASDYFNETGWGTLQVGAIDDAVVERQRQIDHVGRPDVAGRVEHRPLDHFADAQDRHFGMVDNRRGDQAADAADRRDGERPAAQIFEPRFPGPSLGAEPLNDHFH